MWYFTQIQRGSVTWWLTSTVTSFGSVNNLIKYVCIATHATYLLACAYETSWDGT